MNITFQFLAATGLLFLVFATSLFGFTWREVAQQEENPVEARRWYRRSCVWLLCAVAFLVLFVLTVKGQDVPRIVDALAQIESGGNHRAIGKAGERGAWQFTRQAWTQANKLAGTRHPFSEAHDPTIARRMATVYVRWLLASPRMQPPNSDSRLAISRPELVRLFAAWNMGLAGSARYEGNLPRNTTATAKRFANLVCP